MKFKRHISIFLAILVLVSNVGLAFNVHYCGGKIASVSFDSIKTEKGCCEKLASKKDSCCKDKKIVLQKKVDNGIVDYFSFHFDSVFLNPDLQYFSLTALPSFYSNKVLSYYCDAHAPPLFKLYHQFIFYA